MVVIWWLLPLPTHRPRGADGMLYSPVIIIVIIIIVFIIIIIIIILVVIADDDDDDDDAVGSGEYAEKEKEGLKAS